MCHVFVYFMLLNNILMVQRTIQQIMLIKIL